MYLSLYIYIMTTLSDLYMEIKKPQYHLIQYHHIILLKASLPQNSEHIKQCSLQF